MITKSLYWRVAALSLISPFFWGLGPITPAHTQELGDSASAPWMEEDSRPALRQRGRTPPLRSDTSTDTDDLPIRHLSLADLQNLTKPQNILSPLEDAYYGRVIDDLRQYGYDIFKDAALITPPAATVPAGVVQDDYILSAGDKIDIVIRGQENTRQTYEIDAQGLLVIDNFTPIAAAGQTLGTLREALEQEATLMHNTQLFVSLSGVRQINVLVVGHVPHPGRQMMTAFHSVLDALSAAGGIEKTGSLRKIKLVRGGKSTFIDLYSVLMQDQANAEMTLQEGDRIIVPPMGPSIAISGNVKRPAIYEIRPNRKLSLAEMLGLAGGVMTPGNNRYMKLAVTPEGRETVTDVQNDKSRIFGDGAILSVAQGETKRSSDVTLSGHTREPGTHDLTRAHSLTDLIADERVLGNDIYPLIGIIERRDTSQLTKTLIEFSPRQVLRHEFDRQLSEGDIVHLFSMKQIRALENGTNANNDTPLLQPVSFQLNKPAQDETQVRDPLIASFLQERAVFVRGAVRQPGGYPVADGATLDSVLAIAGGTTLEANTSKIEVTSRLQGEGHQEQGRSGTRRINVNLRTEDATAILIGPGDTVRVNQKFNRIEDQSVTLLGEVVHPGRYDLMAGDTVLSLIERAGGLTEQGYPDGAIFSRAAERKREASRYKAQAQDLELKLAASLQQTDADKKPDMGQVQAVQTLVAQLNDAEPVGRITVEIDPETLKADPEQDMLLEAGDKIYIPKRPLNVRVAGEVLSPAALQFRKGKDAQEYIREAGGTTYFADADRAFVIYPDGSAKPLSVSMWNHESSLIPPGSTIMVPRDPKPYNFLEGAERISQILANLAISGLYIEAIGDDD